MTKDHIFAISCSHLYWINMGKASCITCIPPLMQWSSRSVKSRNKKDFGKDGECDKKRLGE